MSSPGYHHRYPPLLMPEYDPLDNRADLAEDDLADDDLDAFYLALQDDAPEPGDDDPAPPGEREHVVARLERMRDPGATVIELEKIPPRLWKETLAPFHRQQRIWIARQVSDEHLRELASELAFELDMAECSAANQRTQVRNAARRTGYPLPSPAPGPAAARSSVQVNLRLRRDDHERLAHAATAVGLKPTTLARSLVLNGAAMILREHGKEHLAPPRPSYTPLRLD